METIIGLVRHGITDWNLEKKLQGTTDIPLNSTGRHQAQLLAKRLIDESWDVVCTSNLSRARETAKIISEYMNIPIGMEDQRLQERSHGRLEGTIEAERVQAWGQNWRELDHGVEPEDVVFQRAMSFLYDAIAQYEGKRILVVTHGGWIVRVLDRLFPNVEYGWIGNTSLSVLGYNGQTWTPHQLNCLTHLEEVE